MVVFKGFEVTIRVNGCDLKEFKDDSTDADADENDPNEKNTITRYIEASTNGRISIASKCVDTTAVPKTPKFKKVNYSIDMDGSWICGRIAHPPSYQHVVEKTVEKIDGECFERGLLFSNLQIVDSESASSECGKRRDMMPRIQKMGIIEVNVWRVEDCWRISLPNQTFTPAVGQGEAVPEKALKGDSKSHYVQFSEQRKIPDPGCFDAKYIDKFPHPYARFRFKYCSRKCLEDMLIVPRPPTLEERNVQDLNPTELRELVALMKQRQSEQAQRDVKIKPEPGTGQVIGVKRQRESDDEDIEQTGERAVRRGGSTIPILPGETVDLTDE